MSVSRSWRRTCATVEGLLLRRRKMLGLTQQDIADRIGVNVRTFKRFECDESQPTFRETVRWAEALGLEITVSTAAESDSSVTFKAGLASDPAALSVQTHHFASLAAHASQHVAARRSLHGNSPSADFQSAEAAQ